jgi:hypothetical protein
MFSVFTAAYNLFLMVKLTAGPRLFIQRMKNAYVVNVSILTMNALVPFWILLDESPTKKF